MMRDGRIKYFAPTDYTEGSQIDLLVKKIIDRTASNEALESIYYDCKRENKEADKESDAEELEKIDLMLALEASRSFSGTHAVVDKLQKVGRWTGEERETLFRIAVDNCQVRYILGDLDVKSFYTKLLRETKALSENAKTVKEIIETANE